MRTSHQARTAVLVLSLLLIAATSPAPESKAVAGTELAGVEAHQETMEPTEVVAAFHAALAAGDGDAALALMAARSRRRR